MPSRLQGFRIYISQTLSSVVLLNSSGHHSCSASPPKLRYLQIRTACPLVQSFTYSTLRSVMQYRKMAPISNAELKQSPSLPRPSASVILISPQNEVLLLHRVQTSSSYPSAHVFPGGNISAQDGELLPAGHQKSLDEAIHYRRAAIRELFEESGILLAKNKRTGAMVYVNADEREKGRHAIHQEEITFLQWLKIQDEAAEPDTDSLVPFSHWITPIAVPKRFTTQMYIYFLPLPEEANGRLAESLIAEDGSQVQEPASDGGIEITEARFLPATEWLRLARIGEIIMFPPQVLLLTLLAQFLDRPASQLHGSTARRAELLKFIHSGNPPWSRKYILPQPIGKIADGRTIFALDHAGPELQGLDKKGESDRVVVLRPTKQGPRDVEIRWRRDVIAQTKKVQSSL